MGAVEPLQIEVERHFRQGFGARRQRRRHVDGHRQQAAQVQIGGAGQIGRQQGQRDVRAVVAARRSLAFADTLGRRFHGGGSAAAVVARGNRIDPVAQVLQRPGGEFQQHRRGCALIGEVAVVELLACPGRVSELLEPDHARAALERVERAPQRGECRNVFGCTCQIGTGSACGVEHLFRFFEEDLAHLVVFGEIGASVGEAERHRRGHAAGRTLGLQADRVGGGRHEVDQCVGKIAARMGQVFGVLRCFERFLGLEHGGGQRRLIGGLRFVRQALEVT